jgi:hypothetical protein
MKTQSSLEVRSRGTVLQESSAVSLRKLHEAILIRAATDERAGELARIEYTTKVLATIGVSTMCLDHTMRTRCSQEMRKAVVA